MNSETVASFNADGSIEKEIDSQFYEFDFQRVRALERTMAVSAKRNPSLQSLRQMHRLCVLYAHQSRPVDGYTIARVAVKSARILGDRDALRRALTARGTLKMLAGDVNGAIEDNVEAYELAKELNETSLTLSSLANLVLALGLIDLDDLALQLAERALAEMPAEPIGHSAVSGACSLMLNTADLLLGRDPRRALQLAFDAERVAKNALCGKAAAEHVEFAGKLVVALVNQVVAAVNLRDERLAASAVEKLREALSEVGENRSSHAATNAFAAYEAHFGDRRRGLRELRQIVESDASEATVVDASRRLIEFYETNGCAKDAAASLFALQKRLQVFRRNVCLEELRRINELDHVDEFDEFPKATERKLWNFGVNSFRIPELLLAKLQHLEAIAINAEIREGTEMNRAQHAHRVGRLCSELAAEAGCNEETQWLSEVAGRLHDIGKCAIPDAVILQSSPIDEGKRAMLREHSEYGARLVADANEPILVQVVAAVRHHHERFDGSGYPSRLRGEEIPLLARIVAICESFDAMLQSRPYRGSRTVSRALEEIERCANTQFDPWLAGLFVRLVRQLQRSCGDISDYLGSQASCSSSVRTFEQLERLMPRGGLS